MSLLDRTTLGIALIVDEYERLLGVATDGDIRRAILGGAQLDAPIDTVMNRAPVTVPDGTPLGVIWDMMSQRRIRQIPVVAADGRLSRLELATTADRRQPRKDNYVVIMAGGLGSRLAPLTDEIPKPLLPVGGKPIIEIIIEQLRTYGFHRLLIAVNYRAEMIRACCGNGGRLDVQITYVEEQQRLGTAGALRLADEYLREPFLVVNGDLLTRVNFGRLLGYHLSGGHDMTVAVRDYEMQVPYGVLTLDSTRVRSLEEKPNLHFFVNAGIYLLSPQVLAHIPRDQPSDMTDLIQTLLAAGRMVSAFPVREYWLDVGRLHDYEQANTEYYTHFGRRHDAEWTA
jgi:NDP-sugar pyrophosphorylase family protein